MLMKFWSTRITARFLDYNLVYIILIIFQAYDYYGVWPPPAALDWKYSKNPFNDPFFDTPFFHDPLFGRIHQNPFGFFDHLHFQGFTDPFVLFNQNFGGLHASAKDVDLFGHGNDFWGDREFLFGSSPFGFPIGDNANIRRSFSRGRHGPNGTRWISESCTCTVNGITYTKIIGRDSEVGVNIVVLSSNQSCSTYVGQWVCHLFAPGTWTGPSSVEENIQYICSANPLEITLLCITCSMIRFRTSQLSRIAGMRNTLYI